MNLTPAKEQTKLWRKSQVWYFSGKKNECELYQRELIEKIISNKCKKTNDRIKISEKKIQSNSNPHKKSDGYDWTENFDGKVKINNNIYYYNLKFVCDKGGSQTRTLQLVYLFIKYQLNVILKNNIDNIYFINILDGDESYNNLDKFMYLLNREKYKGIKKYIYVGDMYDFQDWWLEHSSK
jgi:hypothetical protein